jgi:TatA/E family protein of Tat protein translocase
MGSLGMPEILMILVVALIVFGPRKLPELGKSLGQSLAHFRRASEDFKRQWEDEVDLERRRIEAPPTSTVAESSVEEVAASTEPEIDPTGLEGHTPVLETGEAPQTVSRDQTAAVEPKRDWL